MDDTGVAVGVSQLLPTCDGVCEGGLGGDGAAALECSADAFVLQILDEKPDTVASPPQTLLPPTLVESSDMSGDLCICAICRDKIVLEETSQVKGCEHAYCVTCILRWASYKTEPWCPQCRLPFTALYVYRALDGSDYMFEESVCLLLRASWFKGIPLLPEIEEPEDYHEEDDCYDEYYYKSNLRLGNRRWGDNGYVRAGRREARPVGVRHLAAAIVDEASSSSSTRPPKGKEKEPAKEATGRRAKRAQKREAADKVAPEKQAHQQQHARGSSRRALSS